MLLQYAVYIVECPEIITYVVSCGRYTRGLFPCTTRLPNGSWSGDSGSILVVPPGSFTSWWHTNVELMSKG